MLAGSSGEKQHGTSGTIVCAGTGSGKTLSFYLPALTRLAEDICNNPERKVRILAIYPRKELLKDQFAETFSQCRKLDDYMLTASRKKNSYRCLFWRYTGEGGMV
ncbi:DEAD/DEAH box helicase [Escherichia coli]